MALRASGSVQHQVGDAAVLVVTLKLALSTMSAFVLLFVQRPRYRSTRAGA